MEKIITLGTNTVTIRPLPYDLWVQLEEERDGILEQINEQDEPHTRKAVISINKFARERNKRELAACVDNWDTLRPSLSIRDVREIERELGKLSNPEIESENLSGAVAGAAVPTA